MTSSFFLPIFASIVVFLPISQKLRTTNACKTVNRENKIRITIHKPFKLSDTITSMIDNCFMLGVLTSVVYTCTEK